MLWTQNEMLNLFEIINFLKKYFFKIWFLFFVLFFLLLLLLLLSEALSPKDLSIKASPQAWRYFKPDSQTALRRMLSGHMFKGVQWGDVNNMKMMSRNISSLLSLVCSNFCVRSLSWSQAQPYSREFPSSVLANWHSDTTNRLCTAKPTNEGELRVSLI